MYNVLDATHARVYIYVFFLFFLPCKEEIGSFHFYIENRRDHAGYFFLLKRKDQSLFQSLSKKETRKNFAALI